MRITNRLPDIQVLRHDDQAGAALMLNEVREVLQHGAAVVGYQHASRLRCKHQHFRIALPDHVALRGHPEIDARFSPPQARHDLPVKVGVRLKARLHPRGLIGVPRAASILA